MHRGYTAIFAMCAAAVPAVAHADIEDGTGLYGRVGLGKTRTDIVAATYFDQPGVFGPGGTNGTGLSALMGGTAGGIPSGSSTLSGSFAVRTSPAIMAAMGYDFGTVRAEVEVAYTKGRITGFNAQSVNGTPVAITQTQAQEFCAYNNLAGCTIVGNMVSFPNGPELTQVASMLNLWFDLPISERFTPYVGGGVGRTTLQVGLRHLNRFSWQIGGGVAVQMNDRFSFTADYRHRQTGKSQILFEPRQGINFGTIKTDNLTGSVQYRM